MLLIFKTIVTTAGIPGPLLGDGVKTTCTLIAPLSVTEAGDTLGSRQTVINRAAANGRASYSFARLTAIGLGSNSSVVYLMGAGQSKLVARRAASYEEITPIGQGQVSIHDFGDLDVDAEASGEGWLIFAEVA